MKEETTTIIPAQQQTVPGEQDRMTPVPDRGEDSYRGTGRLAGKRVIVTGGDSAVAITYAREGPDVTPNPTLAPYAAIKAAIADFSAGLAQLLGDKEIRVNSVAPGPIWTPPIPSTMPADSVESFGQNVPLGRAGQSVELAPVYVLPASDEASYISGGHRWPSGALSAKPLV